MTVFDSTDLMGVFEAIADRIVQNHEQLNRLDSALGDGDHGTAMRVAFTAAVDAINGLANPKPVDVLKTVAMTLMNQVGGASGALFGTFFLKAALTTNSKPHLTKSDFDEMLVAGLEGVKQRGRADVGDKTMIDALAPAVDAFCRGDSWSQAIVSAAQAAQRGAESTIDLVAKHGRAKYTAERSIGHQDAGATTIQLIFEALQTYWEGQS